MAGKVGIGATQVPKIAVGGTEIKKVSVGATEVFSGVDELFEPWIEASTDWLWTYDPGGNNQYLDAMYSWLQAPYITSTNKRNTGWVIWKPKQFLSPTGRWAVRMGGVPNRGLENWIAMSADSQGSEMVGLSMTYTSTTLFYRTSKSTSRTTLATGSYGYNTDAWVLVERDADSRYRVSFDGGSTWPIEYTDTARRGEQAHMGYIGCGITSDANVFGTRGYAADYDQFNYSSDLSANILITTD